jgi:hypothetical protein
MLISYSQIAAFQAAARRERSHQVYCLLVRVKQWLTAHLTRRAAALQSGPCCEPA